MPKTGHIAACTCTTDLLAWARMAGLTDSLALTRLSHLHWLDCLARTCSTDLLAQKKLEESKKAGSRLATTQYMPSELR